MKKLALALLVATVASATVALPLINTAAACQGHKGGKMTKLHKKQKPAQSS